MNTSENQPTEKLDEGFTRTWRYKVGLSLIVGGHVILLIGLVLPFLGMSAGISGAVILGGEIVSLASIAFLGKEGFMAIKNKVVVFAKSSYTEPVGRTRHRIGIVLLLTNVVTTYLMMIYAWEAFAVATPEGAAAPVWGLDLEQQGLLIFDLFWVGEISFLVSIYVLGADWWGKFRSIFVWDGTER